MSKKPTVVSFYSGNEVLEKAVNKIIEEKMLEGNINVNLEEILTAEKLAELIEAEKKNDK